MILTSPHKQGPASSLQLRRTLSILSLSLGTHNNQVVRRRWSFLVAILDTSYYITWDNMDSTRCGPLYRPCKCPYLSFFLMFFLCTQTPLKQLFMTYCWWRRNAGSWQSHQHPYFTLCFFSSSYIVLVLPPVAPPSSSAVSIIHNHRRTVLFHIVQHQCWCDHCFHLQHNQACHYSFCSTSTSICCSSSTHKSLHSPKSQWWRWGWLWSWGWGWGARCQTSLSIRMRRRSGSDSDEDNCDGCCWWSRRRSSSHRCSAWLILGSSCLLLLLHAVLLSNIKYDVEDHGDAGDLVRGAG